MLAALALGLLLGGSYFMSTSQGPDSLLVTFPSGTQMNVEVADNPLMLRAGLAFRDALSSGWGMLFIYDRADFHRVSTQHYRFPVDLIWLDEGKRVVHIIQQAQPCIQETCTSYGPPPEKARYVIASHAGFVQEQQLTPGAELRFTLKL